MLNPSLCSVFNLPSQRRVPLPLSPSIADLCAFLPKCWVGVAEEKAYPQKGESLSREVLGREICHRPACLRPPLEAPIEGLVDSHIQGCYDRCTRQESAQSWTLVQGIRGPPFVQGDFTPQTSAYFRIRSAPEGCALSRHSQVSRTCAHSLRAVVSRVHHVSRVHL